LSTCYRFDDVVDPLLEVALDLCANLAAEDRYRRLAAAARRTIPCDAITLLRLDGDVLVPVVVDGLRDDAIARRFAPADHPRLAEILAASGPVRFPDASMPDPFDGLLVVDPDALAHPHACMGCPLIVDGEVTGVLTVDALAPHAFDAIPDQTVALLAALAGAAIRTARLIEALETAAARNHLVAHQLVRDAMQRGGGQLLGTSGQMQQLRNEIAVLATSDLTALITGETGVGKELVAHAIHSQSRRATAALIHVNCAALPESIAESELFGHVRGAFTGAVDNRAGKFEVADGGTLFLDEIGELPLSIQPKLLRALQSGEIQRVGSDKLLRVDVRIIAATNRDLPAEVALGQFRADLFHRLSVYPIPVPALREHHDDISLLAGYFLDEARMRLGLGRVRLSAAARDALEHGDWPGNVRELQHTILRAALRASGGRRRELVIIELGHLGLPPAPLAEAAAAVTVTVPGAPRRPLPDEVEQFKRARIASAIDEAHGNWAEAARSLGLDRGNLHRLAHRLGIAK
jgi:anaerobic nitric oxide reductase transcription regulator